MKNNNISVAIIIASIIIAISIYLSSLNDPLARCMDKVEKKLETWQAAQLCSGGGR